MSRAPTQDDSTYIKLFNEAFSALREQSGDLADMFLRDLFSEGYLSMQELAPREKLFRLLMFFEYYILAVPKIISEVKTNQDKINATLKGDHISDVDFYEVIGGNETMVTSLSNIVGNPQPSKEEARDTFEAMLDSAGLREDYGAFKTSLERYQSYGYE